MIALINLSFEIKDRSLFQNLNFVFGNKHYGLVGPNGVGKSTLARLMLRELVPTSGSIEQSGKISYLAQHQERERQIVSDFLEDIWSGHHSHQLIDQLIGVIDHSQALSTLSGGEWMRLRLAKILAQDPDMVILDEPSNDLDAKGKKELRHFLEKFQGGIILISHDQDILSTVDEIVELSNLGLRRFGGAIEFYLQEQQQERFRISERDKQLRDEQKQIQRNNAMVKERQEKRMKQGAKMAKKGGIPKIILGGMKRKAQKTLGRVEVQNNQSAQGIEERRRDFFENQILVPFAHFDFESNALPPTKILIELKDYIFRYHGNNGPLWDNPLSLTIRAQDRIHLIGDNGTGKTTLIKLMMGGKLNGESTGILDRSSFSFAYLDQHYQNLDYSLSLFENLCKETRFSDQELRNELALIGLDYERQNRKVSTLSGGELLRAGLAKALMGESIPSVIFLDEPTNNLDLDSQRFLRLGLNQYKGCLVVISHDSYFVKELELTQTIIIGQSN